MLNLRKLVKNYKETGSLAEQCSVFSFINEWCFITSPRQYRYMIRDTPW